jgi:hypothetical protein
MNNRICRDPLATLAGPPAWPMLDISGTLADRVTRPPRVAPRSGASAAFRGRKIPVAGNCRLGDVVSM